METKISYAVQPDIPFDTENVSARNSNIDAAFVAVLMKLNICIGIGWCLYDILSGGFGCLVFVVISILLFSIIKFKKNRQNKINMAKSHSAALSKQLNDILLNSEEIVSTILPQYEDSLRKSLALAKIDFYDNAISPFWDRIEEAGQSLSGFNESVSQLLTNSSVYCDILTGKKHNFPFPFPIGTSVLISKIVLDEYNCTVRQAQTKFEFAHIWEHRKTQKILIADFATFEQAKNNIRDSIVSAIGELNHSIKSEFKELKRI